MKGKLVVLSALVAISLIPTNKNKETSISAPIRTVETRYPKSSELIDNYYYDSKIETIDGNTCFRGKLNYSESNYEFIEEIAFDNLDSNDVIECKLEFNPDDMQFVLDLYLLDAYGEVEESERIVSDAFVNDYYRLDSYVVLNDEFSFYISDYYKQFTEDDCGLILIIGGVLVGLITAYHGVSEVGEQVKAAQNYAANCNLEKSGNGMWREGRIFDQTEDNFPGHNCAYYSFGFAYFKDVGCEVAAVYNLMLSLGYVEMLSDTILGFSMFLIEYSFGWGKLGSDPLTIYRYFEVNNIEYDTHYLWNSFENNVHIHSNCKIIMSRVNSNFLTGIHTYFIEKVDNNFFAYNFIPYYRSSYDKAISLDDFNNGSSFIVGYVI